MQLRDWRLAVNDMLTAIAEIQEFVRGLDAESFGSESKTVRAVAYEFVILGEAMRQIPADIQAKYPTVPWPQIRGMRNVVAHNYRDVDVDVLWRTIERDLAPLVPLFEDILDRET